MMKRGGDNPYAVNYDANQKKSIDSVFDDGSQLVDSVDKPKESEGFLAKAKKFSF